MIRRLLQPILKLFFNPNPLIQALHIQSQLNTTIAEREARARRRVSLDQLHYEVHPQPGARDDAAGHRGEEPEDARRVADQPPRVQRAAGARARERRRLQASNRLTATSSASARGPPPARTAVAAAQPRQRQRPLPEPAAAATGRPGPAQPPPPPPPRPARRRTQPSRSWAPVRIGPCPCRGSPRQQRSDAEPELPNRRHPSSAGQLVALNRAIRRASAERAPTRRHRARRRRARRRAVKLAVVVQRYGQAINGGAELHARYIAEHLARHAEVEVLTTCATDYVTWRNELPAGVERVNGVAGAPVPRQARARSARRSAGWSERVFDQPHSLADELDWLDAEGPASPALVAHIAQARDCITTSASSSATATTTRITARARQRRARSWCRRPSATRRSGCRCSSRSSAASARYVQLARRAGDDPGGLGATSDVPSVVVGIGSEVPANPQPARFRQKFDIRGPFAIYVGRIDENKGCKELFDSSTRTGERAAGRLSLVLIGNSLLPIPEHPRIRHLGFLDDRRQVRRDGGRRAADHAVVLREPVDGGARGVGARPAGARQREVRRAEGTVHPQQRRAVLRGRVGVRRDAAGDRAEPVAERGLGRNGRQFFREHYDWPVIERKYLDMLARLSKEARRIPHRRRCPAGSSGAGRNCPPAREVVAGTPGRPVARVRNTPVATHAGVAAAPRASRRPDDRRRRRPGPSSADRCAARGRRRGGSRPGGRR